MPGYVLRHNLKGEPARLALMAHLLDPMLQRRLVLADHWIQTIAELRGDLISSGKLDAPLVDTFLAHCADSTWWSQTIAFIAVHGRARAT